MGVQHAFDVGVAHDPALEVRPVGELDELQAAIGPALTSVEAPHNSADLQRRVELVGTPGISGQAGHAGRERHPHPLERFGVGESMPGVAAVVAAIDGDRSRTGVERPGVAGLCEDRPDGHAGIREGETLPVLALVDAPIGPVLGADIDDLRIGRVDRDRPDLGPLGQAGSERLPVVVPDGAPEEPAWISVRWPGSPVR